MKELERLKKDWNKNQNFPEKIGSTIISETIFAKILARF